MRIRQLEYFIAVAEELHFGRAAKRVHIEQPPLSRQIKALEEDLGVRLLNRGKREVSLTDEGRFFLKEARQVVERLGKAAETLRGMASGEEGTLQVGFVSSIPPVPLASLVRTFREANPRIRLTLWGGCTTSLMKNFASGCIKAGFIRPMGRDVSGFNLLPFSRESYRLMLPAAHHLAGQDRVHMRQLRGEPVIMFPRSEDCWLYDAIIAGFQKAGFCPNIVQETDSDQAIKSLVAAGMGLALASPSPGYEDQDQIAYRPLDSCLPPIEVFLAWPKGDDSPITRKFVDHAAGYAMA